MGLQDLTPQLRTRLRRVEKLVGLFLGAATLLLLAGFGYYLYHTAERKGWFTPKCKYYTFARSGAGLKVGDPILLMGFSVGEITVIEAQPPGSWYAVFLGFEVKRPYYGYIWSDSKARIAPAGFLGQRQIEITAGYDGMPTVYEKNHRPSEVLVGTNRLPIAEAPKGIFIRPEETPTLTERAEQLVAQVEQALPGILHLTNQVHAVLNNVAQLTVTLDATVAATQPTLINLHTITANLSQPHGSLGEWIIPTTTRAHLDATLGTLNTNLLTLNLTLANVAAITSNLAVQVQSNDRILSDLSRLVIETDDLVQGLKRHWLLKGAFPTDKPAVPQPILESESR